MNTQLEIRKVNVKDINRAVYNPRIMSDAELQKLRASMEAFGYIDPLIWNEETSNLVGGHQRFKILLEKGVQEVEVSVVRLPLPQEKVLNLALNKISGDWVEDSLSQLLKELQEIPGLNIELTGFDFPEVSEIIDRASNPKDEDDDFDADAVVDSITEPITKKGDLIILGNHRLLCGDSSNLEDLRILMGENKAHMLDTDIPYNVNLGGGENPDPNTRPKKSRKWDRIYSDDMPQPEYELWMKKVITNFKEFLLPGAPIYMWQGHRQIPPMYQILLGLDFHISCMVFWLKESATISFGDYSFQSETALYGWLKGATHYWAGPANASNVWEVKRDPTKSYVHPCQKPIALAQKAIVNSSQRGDIVLDVFLGSGSVLIGAESTGRRCFGIEIDPKYCDAIVRRYIKFVGTDKVSQELKDKYLANKDLPVARGLSSILGGNNE